MEENNVTTEQPVEQPTQETQHQDTQTKPFEIPTEVQALVGEGKKYKSPEEALKSVPHAQEHIKTLEQELAEAREELTKRRTTQELLDEIKSGISYEQQTAPQEGIQQDNVMALVQQAIQQNETNKVAKTNAASVAKKFQDVYGADAEKVYNKLASDSGLTVAQLNGLATTSPSVVIKLAGFDNKPSSVAKSTGDVNTETYNQSTTPQELSAKVKRGASTKDLVSAWKIAGEKVKRQLA